jgi:UPF0716 protein FxsA
MCGPLLLLLFGLPALEIFVLIEVGARIGAAETLMMLMGAFLLGLAVMRGRSLSTLRKLRAGVPPDADLLGGPLVFLAALLFMVPGFVTDVVALPLLLPPVRRFLARRLVARFGARVVAARAGRGGVVFFGQMGPSSPTGPVGPGGAAHPEAQRRIERRPDDWEHPGV